jgi:hypothetical protein
MAANGKADGPSLYEVFKRIPDPRKKRGRQYRLADVLTLTAVAVLCGARSFLAVAEWAALHEDLAAQLGFVRRKKNGKTTPGERSFSLVLAAVDPARFEKALTVWMLSQGFADLPEKNLAIDGKSLRGSRDGDVPGVHLLAAYSREMEGVIAQLRVASKTNEHKAALRLLRLIPMEGVLATGDAAFCHKDFCGAVVGSGGDYLVTVKDNQPTLKQDILTALEPAFSPS